jgi:hypothetical protein
MINQSQDRIQGRSHHAAFLLYHPKTNELKERITCNSEAWHIFSESAPVTKKGAASSLELCTLCLRWKNLLDKKLSEAGKIDEGVTDHAISIDLYQNGHDRYRVKGGILLLEQNSRRQKQNPGPYLFILERINRQEYSENDKT